MSTTPTPTPTPDSTAPRTTRSTSPGPALALRGVTLSYPDGADRLTVLDDVSMDAPRGEVTTIVGPSGSGKSSLLAVAATLTRPDSGSVVVHGIETTDLTPAERSRVRREHLGIVFQQPQLLASLTCLEQLEVRRHLGGRGPNLTRAVALEMLDRVGLADLAHRRPHQLSGGQQQRVNIARALVGGPSVLLVDEPTSALDHERGQQVMDLLGELTRELDTATVLVTHDLELIPASSTVLRCGEGRLGSAPC